MLELPCQGVGRGYFWYEWIDIQKKNGGNTMGLWIFATFTSYIIKGLCGFANTMVFTAMLSFGSVNANISPVDLLLGYPANAILTWKNRKSLDPKVFIPLSAMVREVFLAPSY